MEISVFIREYAPLAGEAGRAFRIDPVVILAQAAIETGWGESTLCGAVAPLATFPDLPGR